MTVTVVGRSLQWAETGSSAGPAAVVDGGGRSLGGSEDGSSDGGELLQAQQQRLEAALGQITEDSAVTTFEALKARVRELERQLSRGDRYKCLICMDSYTMPLTSIQCWHVHCEECWLRTLVRLLTSCMGVHNTFLFPNMVPSFRDSGEDLEESEIAMEDGEECKRLVEDGEDCKRLLGDGFLSEAESDPIIMELASDLPETGMTYRLATAAGHNPELSGEKVAQKRPHQEDSAEGCRPRVGASDSGHVEAVILAGNAPTFTHAALVLIQLQDANLQVGGIGTYPA
ncbi:UNVERIFIED_CONTAM: hypothetical protein K2H54_056620 [Gekko kuhli]